jgi:hypothetical protein
MFNIFFWFMIISCVNSVIISVSMINNKKRAFCVVECILLSLIAGLRGPYTGDILLETQHFSVVASIGWANIPAVFSVHINTYYLIKAISYLWNNTQFYFFVLGLFSSILISLLIYRLSFNPLLSFYMLVPTGYFAFSLTGIMQGIAIMFLLWAFLKLVKGGSIQFVILVLLASLFHTTALVFLCVYPVSKLKLNKVTLGVGIAGVVSIFIFRYKVAEWLIDTANYRDYTTKTSTGGIAELVVYLAILVTAAVLIPGTIKNNSTIRLFFFTCCIGMIFFMFVPVLTEFFRIAIYFNMFNILLVPSIIRYMKDRKAARYGRMFIYFILMVEYMLFTYHNSSMNLYAFFFSDIVRGVLI